MMGRFGTLDNGEINVIALCKGTERYIWMYRDCDMAAALRSLGRAASDPELSFTWYDCAVLSRKVRQATGADA